VDNDTPWLLIFTVIILCVLLMIIVPVMGFMYVELAHTRDAAIKETNKMRELRRQILEERSTESNRSN